MSTIKSLISRVAVSSLYSTVARSSHASLYTMARSSHASFCLPVPRSRSSYANSVHMPHPRNCQMKKTRLASPEIRELAKMAVEHHNKKCQTLKRPRLKTLQFVALVDGYYKFIAGGNFYFVIKVKDESGDHKYVQAFLRREPARHKILFYSLKRIPDLAVYVPPPYACDALTEHPKYKSFRSKQAPFYDDLDCIFGEEKVTGLRNFEGSESSAHVEPPLDDCDNGDDNEIQPSTSTSSMQTTTSGRRKKRHRMAESMEENMLMGMVEAAKEIAKALKPQKCDRIERALRQLPDMTDDLVFDGMDLLGPDPQLTEVFFGLSEDSSGKAWLMRRLKRQN